MDLNQVTLPATDIRRSVAFYRALGFTLIVDSADYARFECPVGTSTFSLHKVAACPGNSGVVTYFESQQLDQLVDNLKARGIRFDHDPVDQSWLWREAKLKDPDGNELCLFHAGENRKNPPWRVAEPE